MRSILVSLSLLASAAVGVLGADEELKIDVTLPVECERKTKKGDKIQVHYKGTLQASNLKFDSSWDRKQPFTFTVGNGQVIQGWDEGLLDMCIGEKRTLTVPPSKGYGQRAMGPIPAGSTLIFETELMGIDGVDKPAIIITKKSTMPDSPTPAAESVTPKTTSSASGQGLGEKIAQKFSEAVDAVKKVVKTVAKDNDDAGAQEHKEEL